MILGLDISTSTIGICVLYPNGHIAELRHIDLDSKYYKDVEPENRDIAKCREFFGQMKDFKQKYLDIAESYGDERLAIRHVFIEEPLPRSNNVNTVNILQRFNGMCSLAAFLVFGDYPKLISEREARMVFLPEFVEKETERKDNPAFWREMRKKKYREIGIKKSKFTALQAIKKVKESFPDFDIEPRVEVKKEKFSYPSSVDIKTYIYNKLRKEYGHLGESLKEVKNSKGELATCNYDMSDAYVVANAGLEMFGLREKMVVV